MNSNDDDDDEYIEDTDLGDWRSFRKTLWNLAFHTILPRTDTLTRMLKKVRFLPSAIQDPPPRDRSLCRKQTKNCFKSKVKLLQKSTKKGYGRMKLRLPKLVDW